MPNRITIDDFKTGISRVYPLEETYKLYCQWSKENKQPVRPYEDYVKYMRTTARVKKIKYCHEDEYFSAMMEKRSIRWTTGLCGSAKSKDDNGMGVFFGLGLV